MPSGSPSSASRSIPTSGARTPQIVNAFYNATRNEIVFPAGILQPPFFDARADDAANYGGIGTVIGHEISHAFDDEGSRYDGAGVLRNWWTAADRERFEALPSAWCSSTTPTARSRATTSTAR